MATSKSHYLVFKTFKNLLGEVWEVISFKLRRRNLLNSTILV
jgi:hypothetical protein